MITTLPVSARRCRKYNVEESYPNITPRIDLLSQDSSLAGVYTIVNITGINFSNFSITGYSTVKFGSIKNIPISYISSFDISFVVPIDAIPGIYAVQVINNKYPTPLYSNTIDYTVI